MSSEEEEGQVTDSDNDNNTIISHNKSYNSDIQEILYKELHINTKEGSRHIYFNTIYITGTMTMNTNDIFDYFNNTIKPIFIEWIDDNSCNAGWKDDLSAAEAMFHNSKTIHNTSTDLQYMDIDEEIPNDSKSIQVADIPVSVPPGRWRYGKPHPKSAAIFVRFSTKSDKKVHKDGVEKVLSKKYIKDVSENNPLNGIVSESMKNKIMSMDCDGSRSKNPWGDLCQTWGINDHQEIFSNDVELPEERIQRRPPARRRIGQRSDVRDTGDLRRKLVKRIKPETEDISENSSNSESNLSDDEQWTIKSKVPRLRMHADDEEIKKTQMSLDKHKSRKKNDDLRSKLNKATHVHDSEEEEDKDDDDDDDSVHQIHSSVRWKTETTNVWSRLDNNQDSDDSDDQDLRGILSQKKISNRPQFTKIDLRSKINKPNKDRSPLIIELDNDIYTPK